MKTVFVSGCYDILHAGHLRFFEDARSLGDRLVVSFASSDVLLRHKQRNPAIPDSHKLAILRSIRTIDEVVVGRNGELGLDFLDDFLRIKPAILAATEDDKFSQKKVDLCKSVGAQYVVVPKTPPEDPVSTTSIIGKIRAPGSVPMRVDFAGGWLDVPALSDPDGFVVNCSVSPFVSLSDWPYERNSGMGGSGAWSILNGLDGVSSELSSGVGWQDPAIIRETGLCVWRSGPYPSLEFKRDGRFLRGKMAVLWTGKTHNTASILNKTRDYSAIRDASVVARSAALQSDFQLLCLAVRMSYKAQLDEGMQPLPEIQGAKAFKYCGSGHGGYALYLFDGAVGDGLLAVEPYCR